MGRQRGTGSSKKFVAALPPTTKRNTKSQEGEDIPTRDNLPSRPTSRNSRRVRGLSPLPPEEATPTGVSSAPKAKNPPKPKQRSRAKPKKRNEPPPPYPGPNTAVDTTHSESPDNQLTRTEVYVDTGTQAERQDLTGEKATQTERQDTTGEKATQTEHQDPTRERVTQTDHQDIIGRAAISVYSDPTEGWVMTDARLGQTAVADAPATERRPGPSAYQPPPSSASQARKRKNQEGSASKPAGSSTANEAGSQTPFYKRPDFATLLRGRFLKARLFMREDEEGVDDTTRGILETLEAESHNSPAERRYEADVLQKIMGRLAIKNEVSVITELHDVVCPSAERLAAIYYADKRLHPTYKRFGELRDEGWTKVPRLITGFSDPKPDYCVGFNDMAFTDEELDILAAAPGIMSSFTASDNIYFPFLTCEAKSPREAITYAENQNAYAMLVAISSVIDLFRAAKMEKSAHRKVLGFSISYNDKTAVVDAYYPVLAGTRLAIYRTRRFIMAISPGASDMWRSWRFVRNIYEVWAPKHLKGLKMAINSLKFTINVDGRGSRESQTPTPSESAHRGLQQLDLRSPTPQAGRADSVSVFSDQSRRRRAMTAPLGGDSPKRQKTAMV